VLKQGGHKRDTGARAATEQSQEQELLIRARAGDAYALGTLLVRHGRRVHARLNRLLGASRDLDDLVQVTFVNALRSLPSFRGESIFARWLDRIACRVAYRACAHPIGVALESVPEPVAEGADPLARISERETWFRLSRLLDRLGPKKRTAFVLHAI